MILVRSRSFKDRRCGYGRPRCCGAARRQAVDAGIRRHDVVGRIRRHGGVGRIRRHDGVARACDALGPPAWTTAFHAARSDRSDSQQRKFPATHNEGFTESNLLGEKAA